MPRLKRLDRRARSGPAKSAPKKSKGISMGATLRRQVEEARVARKRALDGERRARVLEGEVVMRLAGELDLSRRTIGALLGLSHAMVQRIIDAERDRPGSWAGR